MATRKSGTGKKKTVHADTEDHEFEALLDYLKSGRGFDFTGYKRSTLTRRVSKRMHEVGIDHYAAYQDYLEVHPDEFALLFDSILINVTAFFREPQAWEYLAAEILPKILASKDAEAPVRVWSAGCASGEEAYALVMLLAEAMGERAFRARTKIYATDIDEGALAAARRALYTARDVEPVPEDLRDKYFERQNDGYAFRPELRRSVIFGRHDLVQDAPISRIDLLVCRNVLMYLNAETQNRVLARLHFGLAPHGHLFLGKAEMLLSHADLFTAVELRHRIFSKASDLAMRERLAVLADAGNASARVEFEAQEDVREAALDASPAAQIAVDAAGMVTFVNRAAQELFALTPADCGRPLRDLEVSYRPVELRSLIDRSQEGGGTVRVEDVEIPSRHGGSPEYYDVEVAPLHGGARGPLGASVAFLERTERTNLRQELDRTRERLEQTNEELRSANEELETTNEELQSTNEELETTNEELQSGNEELETMNEELQSTNEELRAINEQFQARTEQAQLIQAHLEAVLAGIRGAVVVVDRERRILSWLEQMHELWGLREEEVRGRLLSDLDIGLPVEDLLPAIESCLGGDSEVPQLELHAVNRRGASIRCRVTCTPLRREGSVTGVIVLIRGADDDGDPPDRASPGPRRET